MIIYRRVNSLFVTAAFIALWATGAGCQRKPTAAAQSPTRKSAGVFRDVAERAGIAFRHTNGATGKYLFIETTPGGCAFLDLDNDGWLDALLVSGKPLGMRDKGLGMRDKDSSLIPHLSSLILYRNNRDGTFRDVTRGAGLDAELNHAQGVAVSDYDNDGSTDVYVTAYGGNRLFHNEGGGRFKDVTDSAGVADNHDGAHWATSAAFGDYDGDGFLDFYVCHYCKWSPETDAKCVDRYGERIYCDPTIYQGDVGRLYHNNRNGTFSDVTARAGLSQLRGRGLGVVWLDYDSDGRQDIYVANDMDPNFLLHNEGNGAFCEVGLVAGVAYGVNGKPLSGMGIAVGDYDNDEREDLYVTNFSGQTNSLYHNDGEGFFTHATENAGLSTPTWHYLGFGVVFADYNRDGLLDIVVGNGHVNDKIAQASVGVSYAESKGLYRNRGDGTFADATADKGDMATPRVTRGLATGDYDNDGRVDALACNQNDRAELFHNESRDDNHWISLRIVGTRSNRSGYGTKVWVTADVGNGRRAVPDGRRAVPEVGNGRRAVPKHFAECRSGFSYVSASDARVYFGLSKAEKVDVRLQWLSGQQETITGLVTNHFYVCTEGQGCQRDERAERKG